MAATVAELLAERGAPVSERDLVGLVDEAFGRYLGSGAAALSSDAAAVLETHGGIGPVDLHAEERAGQRLAADLSGLVASALTVQQVAERMRVDSSRVRHRISDGGLSAIRGGRGRTNRLPAWQFTADGQPLPGLRDVLAAVPDDLHPLDLADLMTTPQPDLVLSERPVTPAAWLAAGGDPAAVAALVASLDVLG